MRQISDWEVAWDDVARTCVKPEMVKAACRGVGGYSHTVAVYTEVLVVECNQRIGKQRVGVRWVDVRTHDEDDLRYRSRLVATEANRPPMLGSYVTAPPL